MKTMTYHELSLYIFNLKKDGLKLFSIGKSLLGEDILATHIGNFSGPQIIVQGGIHAREYITSLLMVKQAQRLQRFHSIKKGGIYFIFLSNPDGAKLVLDGPCALPNEITKSYLTLVNGGEDFSQYKANVNLVDLNTNFDARWGTGAQNLHYPHPENFIGFYPNSEREVVNLINFTKRVKPLLTISYHSKGEIIYYGFTGQTKQHFKRDQQIGQVLSHLTGYPLVPTGKSSGGYKDWCIDKLKIPAYTIEVGKDSLLHPIGINHLDKIFEQNKDVPLTALEQTIKFQSKIKCKI